MTKPLTLPYPALPQLSDAEQLARADTAYQQLRVRRTCRDCDLPWESV